MSKFIFPAIALIAVWATSCEREHDEIVYVQKTFSAGFVEENISDGASSLWEDVAAMQDESLSDGSKVTLGKDKKTLLWQNGDKIRVFDNSGVALPAFTLKSGSGTASAKFDGSVVSAGGPFRAMYPYSASASLQSSFVDESGKEYANVIRTEIPKNQIGIKGNFPLGAALCIAESQDDNLSFKNAVAYIKFKFKKTDVPEESAAAKPVKVTFYTNGGEKISGGVCLYFDDSQNVCSVPVPDASSDKVVMTPNTANTANFSADVFYWLAVRPCGLPNGFKFLVEFSDGSMKCAKGENAVPELHANSVLNVGALPLTEDLDSAVDCPDFSYAGYKHGETAPSEVTALTSAGYTVYNVCDYGAVANDGKSDREAFLKCLEAVFGKSEVTANNVIRFPSKEEAKAVIYFPEGRFILHTADDDVPKDGKSPSQTIQIRAGHFVLRGAGRDKTFVIMQDPNMPSDENVLYSSPTMLAVKHDSGMTRKADVAADAAKGSFTVSVNDAKKLKVGQWVCLSMVNNDPALVSEELKDGKPSEQDLSIMTNITNVGVQIYDYHKIKSISGNTVTFYEPLMYGVDLKYTGATSSKCYNWGIYEFPHYEEVGIEDLTFEGNAKEGFVHHRSWEDDGAYKPVDLVRVTDSWMRRVGFKSVSEGCSVANSANVSVYDVTFTGNRGHGAVRSQASTRVFLGKISDLTDGNITGTTNYTEGVGQFHSVGVSKQSLGAVLWRNIWGSDSIFESHATQPRATLVDCCEGGWAENHFGGDREQLPNHLADLVIWSFNCTAAQSASPFLWWHNGKYGCKVLPPTIVGFHGSPVTFESSQVKLEIGRGSAAEPESLYESQLVKRLGSLPSWLQQLK